LLLFARAVVFEEAPRELLFSFNPSFDADVKDGRMDVLQKGPVPQTSLRYRPIGSGREQLDDGARSTDPRRRSAVEIGSA
jgi:hypothetical protein